jgi:hypothetical protein
MCRWVRGLTPCFATGRGCSARRLGRTRGTGWSLWITSTIIAHEMDCAPSPRWAPSLSICLVMTVHTMRNELLDYNT